MVLLPAGWYSPGAFVFANTVTSMPFIYLIALMSSICVYFIAGLRSGAGPFFRFVGNLFLALGTTESLFVLIVAIVPNFLLALAVGAGLMGIFMLNCGFFIYTDNLPKPVWRYPIVSWKRRPCDMLWCRPN